MRVIMETFVLSTIGIIILVLLGRRTLNNHLNLKRRIMDLRTDLNRLYNQATDLTAKVNLAPGELSAIKRRLEGLESKSYDLIDRLCVLEGQQALKGKDKNIKASRALLAAAGSLRVDSKGKFKRKSKVSA